MRLCMPGGCSGQPPQTQFCKVGRGPKLKLGAMVQEIEAGMNTASTGIKLQLCRLAIHPPTRPTHTHLGIMKQ
jgi:hypothetical protein